MPTSERVSVPEVEKTILVRQPQGEKWTADLQTKWRAVQISNALFRLCGSPKMACECLSPKKVDMHHPDYERPWLVAFLCKSCHRREHLGKLPRPYRVHDLRKGIDP